MNFFFPTINLFQTTIGSRDLEILIDLGSVVRYGQHQEKEGFLRQRHDGFVSLGPVGDHTGLFGVGRTIPRPGTGPKTTGLARPPHNSR